MEIKEKTTIPEAIREAIDERLDDEGALNFRLNVCITENSDRALEINASGDSTFAFATPEQRKKLIGDIVKAYSEFVMTADRGNRIS